MAGDTTDDTLTRNERLVLEVLSRNDGPMKAYELLAALKDKGVKAPMTVYRALERLEDKGLVHKLDGLNSFVICNHDEPHKVQIFFVCANCSRVEEIVEHNLADFDWKAVQMLARKRDFEPDSARVEIRGICPGCDE